METDYLSKIEDIIYDALNRLSHDDFICLLNDIEEMEAFQSLPSAEPEVKEISYTDCAKAMMKMWVDDVLTYGEYSRIMDKLNTHELSKGERK